MKKINLKLTATVVLSALLTTSILAFAAVKGVEAITEVFEPATPANPAKFVKIGVVQWNPPETADISWNPEDAEKYRMRNREHMKVLALDAIAHQAEYISFSEFAIPGYPDIPELPSEEDNFRTREDIQNFVETIPGPSTKFFSDFAKANKVWIQFGLAEKDAVTNLYYNTAVVINAEGKIAGTYRKQNLFELEEHFLEKGKTPTAIKTPFGLMGILLCSDVYSNEVLKQYKKLKVDVLSLSTSWAEYNTGFMYFARAAQTVRAYLIAANQNYFPDSGVINPDGSAQSHIRQTEDAVAYGYLPRK